MSRLLPSGLFLLIVAGVFHYLVERRVVPENDLSDLLQGLLYGLCITTLLLGVRRSRCGGDRAAER